jgi:lipopolysaccharide transport system permease protein
MPKIVIEAGHSERQYWKDLWHFRELFYFLAWRDILVRYKQTFIGIAWAVIRPLLTMAILVVVFNKLAKLPSDGIAPYPILVFAAMLPWQFFSTSLSEASNSLVVNSNLISKVYFPRLIVPASAVITSLVDFAISLGLLAGLMVIFQFAPTWKILTLPLFTLLAFLAALGPGLLMTALNVKYRDVRYIIPFIVQIGLYISPVGFSSSVVPDKWRLIYSINPMVGVIDGFRWAILGGEIYMPGFLVAIGTTIVFLWLGLNYFRKTERTFADVI